MMIDEIDKKLQELTDYQNNKNSRIRLIYKYSNNYFTIYIKLSSKEGVIYRDIMLSYSLWDSIINLKIFNVYVLNDYTMSLEDVVNNFLNTKFLHKTLKLLKTITSFDETKELIDVLIDMDTLELDLIYYKRTAYKIKI